MTSRAFPVADDVRPGQLVPTNKRRPDKTSNIACPISTILGTNSLISADVPLSNKQTSKAAGFRCFRKTGRDADDVTESGRLFHARAAAT